MAFELLEKIRANTLGLNPNQISISRSGTISFGKDVSDKLRKKGFVEIYIDREENRVGFKTTDNNLNGFKFQETKNGKTSHIVSKMVKDLFPRGKFDAKLEKEYIVIRVPEIAKPKTDDQTIKLK
ncbi:MAG TPA: hypothetical protein ENI29_21675 [bacterium]|nr:hypothetical protein [bacterium]